MLLNYSGLNQDAKTPFFETENWQTLSKMPYSQGEKNPTNSAAAGVFIMKLIMIKKTVTCIRMTPHVSLSPASASAFIHGSCAMNIAQSRPKGLILSFVASETQTGIMYHQY